MLRIRAIFDDWVNAKPAPEPPPPVRRRLRTWHVVIAALFLIASAIATAVWIRNAKPQSLEKPKVVNVKPPPPVGKTTPEVDRPTKPPPTLPDPPYETVRERPWVPSAIAAVAALLALLALAASRTRAKQKDWTRRYWRHVLAHQPGPHHYEHNVLDPAPRLQRPDIDEVATILGRALETDPTDGDALDINESLRLTLRAGLAPHLVFQPPPRTVPVLVLQDLSPHMRPWQKSVDRFLAQLIRQAVSLERWYFDGDPLLVSRTPHGHPVALESLALGRAEASLMVVSSGQGIDAESLLELDRLLQKWLFRTWIHPVVNPKYWRRELTSLEGVHIWPMTRAGVRAAAVEISRKGDAGVAPRMAAPPNVTRGDIERMKQLIALVPHPSLELAEELRRRFASDVPEDVVLFLGAEGVFYGETLAIPPAEWKRLLDAASLDPAREREVRQYLLGVLRESEPPAGSAAHLRWQLDTAMHRLKLGEADAMTTLHALAEGPLRDEVQAAVAVNDVDLRVDARLPETFPTPPRDRPPLWRWPHPAHAALALLVIAAVAVVTQRAVEVGRDPIPHQRGVYSLEYDDAQGEFFLAIRRAALGFPKRVDVYRDGQRQLEDHDITDVLLIDAAERGSWFDIRARLPRGNLATSHPVWVPLRPGQVAGTARPANWIDDDVSRRVIQVIAVQTEVSEASVTPSTLLADLIVADDEQAIAELMIAVGSELSIRIPSSAYYELATVSQLVDYVRAALAEANRAASGTVVLTFTLTNGTAIPGLSYVLDGRNGARIRGIGGQPMQVAAGRYNVAIPTDAVSLPIGTIDVVAGEELRRELRTPLGDKPPWPNDDLSLKVLEVLVAAGAPRDAVTAEIGIRSLVSKGMDPSAYFDGIEQAFGLTLDDNDIEVTETVEELISWIEARMEPATVLLTFQSLDRQPLGAIAYVLAGKTSLNGVGGKELSVPDGEYDVIVNGESLDIIKVRGGLSFEQTFRVDTPRPQPSPEAPTTTAPPVTPATRPASEGDLIEAGTPGLTLPRIVRKAEAVYPRSARAARMSATVVGEVLVSETGQVLEVRIVPSNFPSDIRKAAEQAMRRSAFAPGTKDGVRVKAWLTVPVDVRP